MICSVDPKYTPEYIANVFWRKDIGKVSSITLIPQIVDSGVSNTVYITFGSFCDSESGRDFVWHFEGVCGYMFGHADPEEDNIWLLEPNTHYYGELCVGEFTTKFTDDFFASHSSSHSMTAQVSDDEENDEDKFPDSNYIKGTDGTYYSIQRALDYLYSLNEEYDMSSNENDKQRIAAELQHLEMELAIHTDISKLQDLYTQYMSNMTNDDFEQEWHDYMMRVTSLPPPQREVAGNWSAPLADDLINCTMPSMERQVAMTDQEIADLLEEQEEYQKQLEVKPLI
jgi:hypothetical protein